MTAISGNPNPRHIHIVCGTPEPDHAQQMRRFTRLTNAFSKKVDNRGYAVALHFMRYNFCRGTSDLARYARNGGWRR